MQQSCSGSFHLLASVKREPGDAVDGAALQMRHSTALHSSGHANYLLHLHDHFMMCRLISSRGLYTCHAAGCGVKQSKSSGFTQVCDA